MDGLVLMFVAVALALSATAVLAALSATAADGERLGWLSGDEAYNIRVRLLGAVAHERDALDARVRAEQSKLYGGKNPSDAERARIAATVAGFRKRDAVMQWLNRRLNEQTDFASDTFPERLRRLDADPEHGELFWFRDSRANSVVFLLVTCPSTQETHIMLVPTSMDTAKEARAWTFGMKPKDFHLAIET